MKMPTIRNPLAPYFDMRQWRDGHALFHAVWTKSPHHPTPLAIDGHAYHRRHKARARRAR